VFKQSGFIIIIEIFGGKMENEVEQVASTEEDAIVEEYRTWKKNSAFFYDFILARELIWPSLTVQWLPLTES
jgi:hypothetical protein